MTSLRVAPVDPHGIVRWGIGLLVPVVLAAALAGLGTGSLGVAAVAGLGVAAVAGALLLSLPAVYWPTAMLLVTIAAPAAALPVPGMEGQNGSLSPALFMAPLWLVKEFLEGRLQLRSTRGTYVLAVVGTGLIGVLLASLAAGGVSLGSAAWVWNFVVFTVVAPFVLRADAAAILVRVLVRAGAVLGVYAALEVWVLHANPLWAWTGAGGDARASLGFGHPLHAASFFALALVLALRAFIRRPSPSGALVAVCCGTGLVAVGSRGAVIATVVGVVVIAVAVLSGTAGPRRQIVPVLGAGLLVAVTLIAGFAQRDAAGEVDGSNDVRQRSLDTGLYVAGQTGPLGFGPGRAYEVKVNTPGPGTDEDRSIENAWVELYVAVGPVGTASIALFLLGALCVGVGSRSWSGVAAVVTLLVAFGFYNALEAAKPLTMLLLGVAIGLCIGPRDAVDEPVDEPAAGPVAVGAR